MNTQELEVKIILKKKNLISTNFNQKTIDNKNRNTNAITIMKGLTGIAASRKSFTVNSTFGLTVPNR